MATVKSTWFDIRENVLNNLKVHLLQRYVADIIHLFSPKINMIVNKYSRHLPSYVASSEVDDLSTIAQLEFLETVKVWIPEHDKKNIWPLAQMRIVGAMKDHVRFITKTDPSRLYDWVADAAYMVMTVNKRADFTDKIETGDELSRAMDILNDRERRIVVMHTKNDLTFKTIGLQLGVSESQISRIYKAAIAKLKKELQKT
jgi:RNA polymerase sigma factor (sigma-70 family)